MAPVAPSSISPPGPAAGCARPRPTLCGALRLALALLALSLAAGALLARQDPQRLAGWGQEDGPIENLTAALFALASLIAAACCARQRRLRPTVVLPGLFALVCALDELSWGERLFGLHMPQLGGVQLDAVHDLVDLVVAVGGRHPLAALAVAAPLALLAAWRWPTWRRQLAALRQRPDWTTAEPAYRQLLIWMSLLLGLAVVIDASHPGLAAVQTLEETLELHAALALMLGICAAGRTDGASHPADRTPDPSN